MDLEQRVEALDEDVRRLKRNVHGENGLYLGIIATQKDIIRRLEDLEGHAQAAQAARAYRNEREEKRRKVLLVLGPIVVGGAVTSLFGFVTNLLQTLVGVP